MNDATVGLIFVQRLSWRSRCWARLYANPTAMFWKTLVALFGSEPRLVAKRIARRAVVTILRSPSRRPSSRSA